ncbi:hypothetical protein MBLNU13_g10458t1 [Cladosporium sp. NU13]
MAPQFAPAAQTVPSEKDDVVYYHAGSKLSYRKVQSTPGGKGSFTSIPVIDVSQIDSVSLDDRKAIARQLYDSCSTSGFFYIANHGVPESEQKAIFDAMASFFALNNDEKMDAHMHKNAAMRGYEPMMETRLDSRTKGDIKEAFTMGDCVLEPEQDYRSKTSEEPPSHIKQPQNIWPESAPWFRESMYQYYSVVQPLAMKLMRLFALALQDDDSAFDHYFKFPITGMRALHYPPMPPDSDANAIGLGAHADFSWLTLVLQDAVGGLEVLNKDGVWIDAPPKPGTFVCNVGQYLERQTNGIFPATVHRVRNKTGERRYSIPFFLTPDPGAKLQVLESCLEEGQGKPAPIDVGDLYIRRILPARKKHPTSIKYISTPEEEWRYDFLYGA